MKAYYLSKINIKQWENSTGKIFNFEKFISGKENLSYGNFREVCRKIENKENCIFLRFFETTRVALNKFNDDNGDIKPYSEEVEGFFVKISCAIIPHINDGLLITNIAGLSIILRGLGGRRYIDNVIGPMISKHIFGNSSYYSPFSFDESKMKWNLWGDDLREITLDIPGLGRSNLSGQNLSLKTIGDKKIPLIEIISQGNVRRFNVLNKSFGRTIGINRNGTIYSTQDLLGVVSSLNSIKKAIFE